MMRWVRTMIAAGVMAGAAPVAAAAPLRADQDAFFDTYKDLIETNTTLSAGSCTLAAERMAARLEAAGIPKSAITRFAVPEHPKDGGLVTVYPGTSDATRPVLLLAHLDVVEARREDWQRDPFTLVEVNGYYTARGAIDDKAMAAIWVDTLVRFAQSGYRPRRTIKLALTCGEETSGAFNGAEWLATNRRDLIDAAFALNEGGGGKTNGKAVAQGGKLVTETIQVGEKAYQDFTLTATNPGGHSSQPVRDNAIYALADALLKLREYAFPIAFNATTRAYFEKSGAVRGGETGRAMRALVANPDDAAALAIVDRDKMLHSLLRTTCVATMVDAGHALNALPQRATANVNCRMFPGRTAAETRAALVAAIDDPGIVIAPRVTDKPIAMSPPLDPDVIGPMTTLAARYFPGVPVIPSISTGATDGVYLEAVGIPVYGAPTVWTDPDGNGTHGLDERVEVGALYTARDYLFALVQGVRRVKCLRAPRQRGALR